MRKANKKRKCCIYCKENGVVNYDVFIEVNDVELGHGWICKECFLETVKEEREELKRLQQENEILENKLFRRTLNLASICGMFFLCGVVASFIINEIIQFLK